MSSQHRDPALTVRPPASLKEAALAALSDRDLEVQAFVVACFNALVADPDRVLGELAGYWPEKKPRGRPRKAAPATPAADPSSAQEER
ncbi:hypothetical protein AB0O64_36765 [Streptomyces sp. NPDC088341]|uniref:hypothetical protein n=1 Tax=Streptomyces sp. NPDC088341 TaxID=3154870 RepID=UPI00342D0807